VILNVAYLVEHRLVTDVQVMINNENEAEPNALLKHFYYAMLC